MLSFLKQEPFILSQSEKEKIFLPEMRKAAQWHYQNSPEFKKLCDNRNFNVSKKFKLFDLPYLPVAIFKNFDLLSVPKKRIIKTLYSSSTSGRPSKIMLDTITADRQVKALSQIMISFLGKERRHFIIFDTEQTIQAKHGELSSRGTAIRGMLLMAKKLSFILDKNLNLDIKKLKNLKLNSEEKICYFGFTWLIYNIYLKNKKLKKITNKQSLFFRELKNKDKLVLHIGGWKKLKDIAVAKDKFNERISDMLDIERGKIIDFYGMTEQLGTVYPDCEYGYKHAPLYSEVIIRDINTLQPVPNGKTGFIQFLSPIPHSYPGISILSDDIGRIIGVDNCKCGRKGKYFVFEKRSEKAELKGCGDVLKFKKHV